MEPLSRPGAKRRDRCRKEAWKIFGKMLKDQAAEVPDEVDSTTALAAMTLKHEPKI